jgi:hypothetical protein
MSSNVTSSFACSHVCERWSKDLEEYLYRASPRSGGNRHRFDVPKGASLEGAMLASSSTAAVTR